MNISMKSPVVEIPEDLLWALDANAQAQAIFDKLPYSHRKEYVTWIESARKPETRAERTQRTVEMLIAKEKGRRFERQPGRQLLAKTCFGCRQPLIFQVQISEQANQDGETIRPRIRSVIDAHRGFHS